MDKQYEQYSYFGNHRGTHVGDGIYKIDEPYVYELLELASATSANSF